MSLGLLPTGARRDRYLDIEKSLSEPGAHDLIRQDKDRAAGFFVGWGFRRRDALLRSIGPAVQFWRVTKRPGLMSGKAESVRPAEKADLQN
jgi:hypothetical protein